MDRKAELAYMISFAAESCFDVDVCRDQLCCLWTAYCLHHNLDVDTAAYDADLAILWAEVSELEEDTADWSDFDNFDLFMCRYLV